MTKGRCNPPEFSPSEAAMARSHRDSLHQEEGWSEATLTGGAAQSGRYSAWSAEEGEYDRIATEKVNRMFRRLNRALYDGRESGSSLTDRECREWSLTFPHLHVQGDHLLDVMDDGTELVDPIYKDTPSSSDREKNEFSLIHDEELVVIGRHIDPICLGDTPEEEVLKEEILAKHGVLEEYIATDKSSRDSVEGSIQNVVMNQLMDVLWSEVSSILEPLVLIAAKNSALKCVTSKNSSRQTSLATSHSTSPYGSSLHLSHHHHHLHHHHSLGTAGDPTSYHNPQFYENKPATSGLVVAQPILPRLTHPPPPLSGLMHIKPVSLKHRNLSMLQPQNEKDEDILTNLSGNHHHHHHHPGAPSHHDPRPGSHFPAIPPPSSPPLGTTAGTYRGGLPTRGGPGIVTRRPQQLRPLENPRTPALEKMERPQIRGFRVPVNTVGASFVGLSPPPTAGGGVVTGGGASIGTGHIRNIQLPPLEIEGGSVLAERSPPVVRGKSTFSNRNTSNAALLELQELRRLQLSSSARPSDTMRPNTSSSNYRIESGKTLTGKKVSELLSPRGTAAASGGMKVVGFAAGVTHSTSTIGAPLGLEGVAGNSRLASGLPYSIAEDNEVEETSTAVLNVTGHSSTFTKAKPRSLSDSRSKHRGHGR